MPIIIRGAGDLATGIAIRLHNAGFKIIMTELAEPTAIRRTVSFSDAVFLGEATVEGVRAQLAADETEAKQTLKNGDIAVVVDEQCAIKQVVKPYAIVDATVAKRNIGTSINDAQVVIGVGPGFCAGVDCHAVIETERGHNLGRVIINGSASENTGVPGNIGGYSIERLLRAPCDGVFKQNADIGAIVKKGNAVASVNGLLVTAEIGGVLRGILRDGANVTAGMKCGDIDPRAEAFHCFTVSDKARAIGGGVLESLFMMLEVNTENVLQEYSK